MSGLGTGSTPSLVLGQVAAFSRQVGEVVHGRRVAFLGGAQQLSMAGVVVALTDQEHGVVVGGSGRSGLDGAPEVERGLLCVTEYLVEIGKAVGRQIVVRLPCLRPP
ncbi:hypothetical protein ACH4E9_33760 [Streptomyces anulatus]